MSEIPRTLRRREDRTARETRCVIAKRIITSQSIKGDHFLEASNHIVVAYRQKRPADVIRVRVGARVKKAPDVRETVFFLLSYALATLSHFVHLILSIGDTPFAGARFLPFFHSLRVSTRFPLRARSQRELFF